MKGRKHTPEQIVRKLREADRMTAEGATVAEAAKALEISEHASHAGEPPTVGWAPRT